MKYVAIFAVVILLVRIDVILSLSDKIISKLGSSKSEEIIEPVSTKETELISFSEDPSLKQTPRKVFFALLLDFLSSPTQGNRIRALEILKKNPSLFSGVIDPELESVIYQWRDLYLSKDIETFTFLIELQENLLGENKIIVEKFMSLMMQRDLDFFLKSYLHSKDTNCIIATLLGDNLSAAEKLNEFYDRERVLNLYLTRENTDPGEKALATRCLMILRLHLNKINPPKDIENSNPSENP